MADFTTDSSGFDSSGFDTDTSAADECSPRRGPSILLLLSALAALAVSGWAMIGPFSLDFVPTLDLGWITIGLGVVIGAILILLPTRRRKNR